FMLPFAIGSAGCAAHRVVEAAQSAARAGIHIADADYDGVGLVIEIEAVVDQLFEVDILGEIEAATTWAGTTIATRPAFARSPFGAAFAPFSFAFAGAAFTAFRPTSGASRGISALAGRSAPFP